MLRHFFIAMGWVALLLPAAGAATKPEPPLVFPLDALGVPAIVPRIQAAGRTLYTVNFVDDTHLLLTYYTRGLMTRLPDADASDVDGLVAAVLLELPTGKELARTQWRVRDRNQYLWPLGHGHFLLRVRTRLTVLNPLGNLARGEAFQQEQFGTMTRRIGYITTSPGGDLLSIETLPPLKARTSSGQAVVAFDEEKPKRPDVEIYFYRMAMEDGHLAHKAAGVLAAHNLVAIPANSDGYLQSVKESAKVWNFDYVSHDGKKVELAPFDTSCSPQAYWVSRSEFVALGCDVNSANKLPQLGGFDLRGRNEWVSVLSGNELTPELVPSPESGRFALSRVTLSPSAVSLQNLTPEETQSQEITVRQSYDGRVLLKQAASPVQRAGHNFDLSPSGLELALVQNSAIAVYKVQALTGKDQAALKTLRAAEPAVNEAKIRLNSVPADSVGESVGGTSQPAGAVVQAPAAAAEATAGVERSNTVGDVPAERRKPPTLYDDAHPKEPK